MTTLHANHKQPQARHVRFCAFAVMASALAFSCGRKDTGYQAPEPSQTDQAEIPHFIPPKGQGGVAATPRAPATATQNAKPGTAAEQQAALPDGRGCKENMARVKQFCIDRYEIHLVGRDGAALPYNQPAPYNMNGIIARSSPGVFPQGHLSQETSRKACENAGKRLCTLDEWQSACNGMGSRKYPYGVQAVAGNCNVNKRDPHILDKHFPDIPHMKRAGKQFNDPALLLDPDYLEKTGQRTMCVTPDGLFDMDGNLSEWVDDTVQKGDGLHGTFAGDAFSGAGIQGCERKTQAHTANYLDYSMGTRCCKNPSR
jgi:formylglycine-generating enzyme